jgi:O-antigen/teichoic acid export membrane protein
VKSFWYSPTLRSIVIYGAAGLGFAGANLILARVLPTPEYGLFTLVIALTNLSFAMAPLGVDGVVNRRHLEAGPSLLKRTLAAGLVTALGALTIAGLAYEIDTPLLVLVFAATVGGGAMVVAAAQFQSEQRYGISLALTQSPNLVLIIAALAVVWTGIREARLPVAISSLGFVLAGVIGWWILFGERGHKPHRETRLPWGEALSLAGVSAAGLILVQLDRLIIPHVLTLHDLATFGVLAAIAGSLFRVLAMGVGYTLLPRLRAASTVTERRHLIAHEVKLVLAIIVAGSIAIWFLTPWIEHSFLAGKYHLDGMLLLATLFTGVAKIMNSLTRATVSALATPEELSKLNWFGWVSVVVALVAGIVGARWGLAGVIYGVGLGWLMRGVTGSYLTLRHLALPESIPATKALSGPHFRGDEQSS